MDKGMLRLLGMILGAAMSVAFYVLSGFFIGTLIESKFQNIKPFATVVLTLVGMILGFYRLYQVYKKTEELEK